MTLTLRYAARSDRGLIRSGNQDSVYAGPRLLAVADGMGGMAAGDVASNIVIGTMAPLDEDVPGGALLDALRGVVESANQQLRDTVDANPAMEGMGTTLTAMLFSGSRIGMVHIGDSRAYMLRDGEFGQITKDDTYVQMLIDEGRITPEEADSHPQRHLLYRALDGRDAEPEYSVREAHPGDRYMLCSDGLSGVVSAETIAATLREYVDANQCAERLVQLALRGGGPDNITVIVADVTTGDITESVPIVGGAAARDRGMATSADETMSAARASAVTTPRSPVPEAEPANNDDDDDDRPRRHPLRALTVTAILVLLLGGGLYGGYYYTQTRYYVGVTEDGTVAVFQGVPAEIAGLHFNSEHKRSDTNIDDLNNVAQDAVRKGIAANSEADAERKMDQLTTDQLKACPPGPTPSGPDPDPNDYPSGSASSAAPSTPTGTLDGSASGSPSVTPDPSATSANAQPTPSPTNCRNP
ncbi:protein phosphatase 2C domain-containing protein [Virgisporangium ochraceum]|uniref:Serine/threonine protein phosphatase PstP n=1 Tax=Virgisporangium ochraceum TaxID=65505 RepID=A0A8J3ZM16_9ACTN|nr:protein phosphatase 2C domain-containing protein [Virgisporangium ochraceum]GIJ66344.1 putative serine/threonine phosphatase Ppp [Virgisporangium ochraceum]